MQRLTLCLDKLVDNPDPKFDPKKKDACLHHLSLLADDDDIASNLDSLKRGSALRTHFDQIFKDVVDVKARTVLMALPIFGITLHKNDAWVVTGIFGLTAMLLLREFMKRELENINTSASLCPTSRYRDLIIGCQIFALPATWPNGGHSWFTRQAVFTFMYFIPFILHVIILGSDSLTTHQFDIVSLYLGPVGAGFLFFFEILTAVFLAILGWKCNSIGMSIDQKINDLSMRQF